MRTAFLVFIALLAGVSASARAQGTADQTSDVTRVSVATGAGTVVEIVDSFVLDLGNAIAGYETTRTDRRQVVLRADRDVSSFGRVGITYAYAGWSKRLLRSDVLVGDADDRVHAILVHGFLRWTDGRRFELYSGLGAGVALWQESVRSDDAGVVNVFRQVSSRTLVAWQLHLLGIAVGNEWLRVFGEVGFGYEGLGVLGLAARF